MKKFVLNYKKKNKTKFLHTQRKFFLFSKIKIFLNYTKMQSNQSIYIPSLNSYYPPESVINSAYRKVLDFKENAEKILEKEKSETLNLNEFSRAILECKLFIYLNLIYIEI